MVRASIYSLIIASLLAFSPASAVEILKPHVKPSNPQMAAAISQKMERLEMEFMHLKGLSEETVLDYLEIRPVVETMQKEVAAVRGLHPGSQLDKPLQDLSVHLARLHGDVLKRRSPVVRDGVEELLDSCFRCHVSGDPR